MKNILLIPPAPYDPVLPDSIRDAVESSKKYTFTVWGEIHDKHSDTFPEPYAAEFLEHLAATGELTAFDGIVIDYAAGDLIPRLRKGFTEPIILYGGYPARQSLPDGTTACIELRPLETLRERIAETLGEHLK